MKVSSTSVPAVPPPSSQYGKNITKPGIYRSATTREDTRLIVVSPSEKLYFSPKARSLLLQKADASLAAWWTPVKEKITITFDSTDEE